jgi:hypothetical protein
LLTEFLQISEVIRAAAALDSVPEAVASVAATAVRAVTDPAARVASEMVRAVEVEVSVRAPVSVAETVVQAATDPVAMDLVVVVVVAKTVAVLVRRDVSKLPYV